MEKRSAADKLKLCLILGYFLVLGVERIISVVTVLAGDLSQNDALEWYMTALTLYAIFGAVVFIVTRCNIIVKRYDDGKISASPSGESGEFAKLAVAAGIMLLGGMVHTRGTIPGIQFASYGILLAAMGIHAGQCVKKSGGADKKWISFAYITAFSMSIPVVYHVGEKLQWLVIPVECVVSVGMTVLFTIMLRQFFEKDAEYDFSPVSFIAALAGVFAVIILRWDDPNAEVKDANVFVLIFICVAAALWFAGNILYIIRNNQEKNKNKNERKKKAKMNKKK